MRGRKAGFAGGCGRGAGGRGRRRGASQWRTPREGGAGLGGRGLGGHCVGDIEWGDGGGARARTRAHPPSPGRPRALERDPGHVSHCSCRRRRRRRAGRCGRAERGHRPRAPPAAPLPALGENARPLFFFFFNLQAGTPGAASKGEEDAKRADSLPATCPFQAHRQAASRAPRGEEAAGRARLSIPWRSAPRGPLARKLGAQPAAAGSGGHRARTLPSGRGPSAASAAAASAASGASADPPDQPCAPCAVPAPRFFGATFCGQRGPLQVKRSLAPFFAFFPPPFFILGLFV